MRGSKARIPIGAALLSLLSLGLAGCGGGLDSGDAKNTNISLTPKLAGLLGMKTQPETGGGNGQPKLHLTCPQILVLDGTAAHRVYAGSEQTNETVRYQFSIDDVARECELQGSQLGIKVGVQGKVLLGPAGSPGNFNVPVKISVIRESDDEPIVTKSYRANVSLSGSQSEASFTIVSDILTVPFVQEHTELDYSLRVAVDEKGGAATGAKNTKRRKPAE